MNKILIAIFLAGIPAGVYAADLSDLLISRTPDIKITAAADPVPAVKGTGSVRSGESESAQPVPIKHLKCFHYQYNDPAGARDRSDMEAKPFLDILPGNFNYGGWQAGAQKLLIRSLDKDDNVVAIDQAVAWQITTQIGDGHGSIDISLNISVVNARSELNLPRAPYSWELGFTSALDDNWKLFNFWNDYHSQISCIEAALNP